MPRLVVLAAPAGFGKTTLLLQWLTHDTPIRTEQNAGDHHAADASGLHVVWISLDAEDSDMRRFLTHVLAAVHYAFSASSEEPSPLPDTAARVGAEAIALLNHDPLPVEDIVVSLVNDLDTAGPTAIALDDYHVITDSDIHQAMTFLVDNLPPQVVLVIATRADPPLPVACLRARGELIEVRAADLRFTNPEATAFLNGTMGLSLSPDHVAALGDRTEGWAVGLQLAGLSVRARSNAHEVDRFVESFSGSHRFILDYLLDEVLSRQPDDVRDFLLATSVLTQLTAGLCEAVTGCRNSQQMLERLEADGLFIIALDDERQWFRYHHLFADALRARLTTDLPDQSEALHASAAHWLAEHGFLTAAVHHALSTRDHDHAADLIELSLGDQRRRRQDPILREWASRLDDRVVRRRPLLATFLGWSRLVKGDVEGVEPWLDVAESSLNTALLPLSIERPHPTLATALGDRDAELRGLPSMISVYRAAVAQARGDSAGTVVHAHRALELARPEDHFSRGAAKGFLGLAAWATGDLVTAVDTFTGAIESLEAADMQTDALGSVVILAHMWLGRGDTRRARTLFEKAIADAERRPGPVLSVTGDLYVGLADVLREQGDLHAAEQLLQIARTLGERASLPENRHRWFTAAAGLCRARGDLEEAGALLGTAENLYLPGYFPDVKPIPATRARVWISQGLLDHARSWASQRHLDAQAQITHLNEYDLLTLARLLIADGECHTAIHLVGRILEQAEATHRTGSIIEARLVRAMAHDAAAAADAAAEDLIASLDLGVPGGYCRLYLDEGLPVRRLLAHLSTGAGEVGDSEGFARHLLEISAAAAPDEPSGASIASRGAAPDVGASTQELSARELEVLRLLATELSGPDIARHLFVSVNTFRTHTKHIFAKLDVRTRRSAVLRATELALL